MQFAVPQFVDIEDKVVGPFTVKQFIYMVVGAGAMFALYSVLKLQYFVVAAAPVAALTLAFAFAKINGRPFYFFLGHAFKYVQTAKEMVWSREAAINDVQQKKEKAVRMPPELPAARPVPRAKLQDLSVLLDTAGHVVAHGPTPDEGDLMEVAPAARPKTAYHEMAPAEREEYLRTLLKQ